MRVLLQGGSSLFIVAASLLMPAGTPASLVYGTVGMGLISTVYHASQPSTQTRWLGARWSGSQVGVPWLADVQWLDKVAVTYSMLLISALYYDVVLFGIPGPAITMAVAVAAGTAGDRAIHAVGAGSTAAMLPLLLGCWPDSYGHTLRYRIFGLQGGALAAFFSIPHDAWPHIPRYVWHGCCGGVLYTAAQILAAEHGGF